MNNESRDTRAEETDLRFFELYQIALRATHTPMLAVEAWRDSSRDIAIKLLEGAFYQGAPMLAADAGGGALPGHSAYGPGFTGIPDSAVSELLQAALNLTMSRAVTTGGTDPVNTMPASEELVRLYNALDLLLVSYIARPKVRR